MLGLALGPVLAAVIDHRVRRAVPVSAAHPRTGSKVRSMPGRPLAEFATP